MAFADEIAHTHNNRTQSLTITESLTFSYETQNTKPKIVRTADYNCAHVSKMAVLIIFPVFLQTVVNLIILSIEEPTGGLSVLKMCKGRGSGIK